MSVHVNITIFLVILNALLIFTPQTSQYAIINGAENSFLNFNNETGTYNIYTNEKLINDTTQSVSNPSETLFSVFGILDTFKLILDIILWGVSFFVAFPILLVKMPLPTEFKFFLFVPLFIMYCFSLAGWLRTGRSS